MKWIAIFLMLINLQVAAQQEEPPYLEFEILVFDKEEEMPLEGVEVFTNCPTKEVLMSNQDGKIMARIDKGMICYFKAEKEGYTHFNI